MGATKNGFFVEGKMCIRDSYEGALEDIFDAPDGLGGQSRVERVRCV